LNKISYVSSTFKNNECFLESGVHNRDGFLDFLVDLKKTFKLLDVDLSTDDINLPSECEVAIHANLRPDFKKYLSRNNVLIIFESEAIMPDNFKKEFHDCFDIILTWKIDLIDNLKYFYINYSHKISDEEIFSVDSISGVQRSGKVMICSNKHCNHKGELYSERLKIINWYEKYNADDFYLYGTRWDIVVLKGAFFAKIFNAFNRKFKVFKLSIPSYKGLVDSKNSEYKKRKFAYCLENAKGINGYITEKIFDAFRAGIVPIYVGDIDVYNIIPENCFINYTKFSSISVLNKYLDQMNDNEYEEYQKCIKSFLLSEGFTYFSSKYFSNIVTNKVMELNNG